PANPGRVRWLVSIGQGMDWRREFAEMSDNAERREPADNVQQAPDDDDPVAVAAMIRSYPALAVSDASVRAIRAPVLAIVGDRDPRAARASRLRAVLPASQLVVFPGRTHATVIEDPRLIPEILD